MRKKIVDYDFRTWFCVRRRYDPRTLVVYCLFVLGFCFDLFLYIYIYIFFVIL
jgi:hypothetical protein